jgi:hypothetical protein
LDQSSPKSGPVTAGSARRSGFKKRALGDGKGRPAARYHHVREHRRRPLSDGHAYGKFDPTRANLRLALPLLRSDRKERAGPARVPDSGMHSTHGLRDLLEDAGTTSRNRGMTVIPRIRKNELLELIRAVHPEAQFEGEGLPSFHAKVPGLPTPGFGEGFRTTLSGSPLWFAVFHQEDSFHSWFCEWTTFSPAYKKVDSGRGLPWSNVLEWFESWLSGDIAEFLAERSAPDLWSYLSFRPEIGGITLAVTVDSAPFRPDEQQQIREALRRFRNLVTAEFKLTTRQLHDLDERLSYLTRAVARLNRFDWKSLALSSLVTIAATLSLNSEQGRRLAQLFKQAFSAISGLLQ